MGIRYMAACLLSDTKGPPRDSLQPGTELSSVSSHEMDIRLAMLLGFPVHLPTAAGRPTSTSLESPQTLAACLTSITTRSVFPSNSLHDNPNKGDKDSKLPNVHDGACVKGATQQLHSQA